MALSRQVFYLQDITRVKHPFGPVSDPDFHLTGQTFGYGIWQPWICGGPLPNCGRGFDLRLRILARLLRWEIFYRIFWEVRALDT